MKISSGRSKIKEVGQFPVYGSTGKLGYTNEFTHDGKFILVARVGANAGQLNCVNCKFGVTDNTLVIELNNEDEFHFYFYLLQSVNLNRFIFGSGQPLITGGMLKSLNIIQPSVIAERKKIADFLSSVDKKISLLKEKHALLQQYKKGVMQKLFKQEIRFKNDNGNAFPDWLEKSMGQVLTPEIREIPKPNEKYLALGIRSHMKGTFQKPDSDPNNIAMEKLYVVRPNDLVLNITFAWEGAIAIACQEDDGGLVSHRFPTYLFKKDQATHRYFKHIIQLKRFKYLLDLISPGGAGRNRVLSKSEFLKLKWELPSIEEQEKIADFLDALDTKIDAVSKKIELTQTFKKGLLQQMFV
ncbi:type I restriction enzyme, S subunit [Paraglaciecola chathamensis S18K6]|uniref:Type I restriction enzyme, S subunit n=2 Tax=Paraglaciecola chathamensis TaxID=368405 RepID=A0AAV3UTZ4_9ALTE|nr:type I restriction enzyme, S subunit [Paraglaciecola chathamensis S18K6]